MKTLRVPMAVLLALALGCAGLAQAAHPKKSKFVVSASMSGKKVVANGDPNAKGHASLTFKKKKDRVCFDIDYSGMDIATRGILGEGAKHDRGDNVLTLFSLSKSSPARGCLRALSKHDHRRHREDPQGLLRDARDQGSSRRGHPRAASRPELTPSA